MKQHPLVQSVEKTLLEFSMLHPRDKVLVTVSGGPDSVALLHVLLALQKKFDIQLGVAHLDHGLRPSAAARDAAFVSSLCNRIGMPLHAAKTDIRDLHQQQRGSLEALGRKARYHFFSRIARKFGYSKIALGHHAGDNAELVLMNLLRGSGPLGLAGIPPVRNNRYIRPLIEQPRKSILNYLQDNQVAFVLDATNDDLRFLRNRIRHELMPELIRRYNPNLVDTLNRTAAIFRAEEDWLNQYSGRIFNTLADCDATSVRMPISTLLEKHAAIQRRTIRTAIGHVKGNLKSITLQHIDAVLCLCREGSPGQLLHLPGRLTIQKQPEEQLSISRQPSPLTSRASSYPAETMPLYTVPVPHPDGGTRTMMVKELGIILVLGSIPVESISSLTSAGQHTAFFDMDKLTFPMLLRNTLPGDRFMPLGMQGTQKVKDFFINNKIPREMRLKTPVLVSKDTIVWIVGHRLDERAKIVQQTRNVLKIELFLA
jgi:tRNA(Ile)-lysidine synthase